MVISVMGWVKIMWGRGQNYVGEGSKLRGGGVKIMWGRGQNYVGRGQNYVWGAKRNATLDNNLKW